MEDTQSVATLIDSTTSKIQQLQQAFAELESHRAVTLNLKWKQLEEHFHGLEKSLKRRFHELEDQEKEYETKTMKAREMLEYREAAVVSKEHASLDRLQEKRDAAVFSIATVLNNRGQLPPVRPTVVFNEGQEGQGVVSVVEEKPPDTMTTEFIGDTKIENRTLEVISYPQLIKICEDMNSEGLHKFISDNRKNLQILKEEIPIAFKAASSPAKLVLSSLQGFYAKDVTSPDAKKDSNLLGIRRTCIMLMECLCLFLSSPALSSANSVTSEDVKKLAKDIAEEWKPKLDALDIDASNGNSLEAHAFLQLLSTFGVASDFDQDELSRLIPMVSRRHQVADLCRSLGLSGKMTGVIEVLINSGRQIGAVNLAFAFELKEKFPPVPLLQSYLKEMQKVSSPVKPPGSMSPTAQNDVNERELSALKAVIKCIEEHKLEAQYPLDPLQKQVFQLEKAKAEKKRVTEPAKPLPKRPRASGITYTPPRSTNTHSDQQQPFYTRYPPYVYDNRSYGYLHIATENHVHLPAPPYNLAHNHGNYFGNGYQYQAAPYLH